MAEMLEAKLGPSVEPGRVKTATTKSGDVKTAMTEAAPEAPKAPVEATKTAMAATTTATAPRRHNVGCKHSKCCNRQQRHRDFTQHEHPLSSKKIRLGNAGRRVECRPIGDQLPSKLSTQA
jgi:hypothetical protein